MNSREIMTERNRDLGSAEDLDEKRALVFWLAEIAHQLALLNENGPGNTAADSAREKA